MLKPIKRAASLSVPLTRPMQAALEVGGISEPICAGQAKTPSCAAMISMTTHHWNQPSRQQGQSITAITGLRHPTANHCLPATKPWMNQLFCRQFSMKKPKKAGAETRSSEPNLAPCNWIMIKGMIWRAGAAFLKWQKISTYRLALPIMRQM